jgi:hypothetical protein
MNGNGTLRWSAIFGSLGAFTGLLGAAPAAAAGASMAVLRSDYQSAASAPAAWQAFAKQLQSRFQERLAAEDDLIRQFQEALAKRTKDADAPGAALTVRAWILPGGQIERVESDQLDGAVATRLRALLSRADVGPPPADMLQPLHMRLSLQPKDKPEQGH